ncbi:MAG: xylulokinase [Bacteroidaceae bacterium]|jgi:xylulokinase
MKKYLLGYDIGSSSVKASLVSIESGKSVASAFYPDSEAPIKALNPGWAEQEPEDWWKYLKNATASVMEMSGAKNCDIEAIGISYQMHGLVCVDRNGKVLRPAIIWCDSRAVPYGERAFREIGKGQCLTNLLNSPGNFTAAKLAWVKENEPHIYENIDKVMLPGDYIAMRLTGTTCTTVSGLSEGIVWNFKENEVADFLLDYFGFSKSVIPEIRPTFSEQGRLSIAAAKEIGIEAGTPVTYRAGDQPNNALSLNVFNPGEIAATAGTSGVVYGVNGKVNFDPQSRVNTFAHVNHSTKNNRLGVLLCINGTGILNAWTRRNIMLEGLSYSDMNEIASSVPVGSDGVAVLPFGNGAERMLGNRNVDCSIHGFNFNIHNRNHMARAVQEGVVFSFKYGMDIMAEIGMEISKIHAGNANMFLNPVFREALSAITGATIELYDTDGAVGAAKGAGMGAGVYRNNTEAFSTLEKIMVIEPDSKLVPKYEEAYAKWRRILEMYLTEF